MHDKVGAQGEAVFSVTSVSLQKLHVSVLIIRKGNGKFPVTMDTPKAGRRLLLVNRS